MYTVKVKPFTTHPWIWLQEYSQIRKSCEGTDFYSHPAIWLREYSHIHKSCERKPFYFTCWI